MIDLNWIMTVSKKYKRLIQVLVALFVMMNAIAIFHAYKFTHFSASAISKTQAPERLTFVEKVKPLLLGVSNPRPQNKSTPAVKYTTVVLQSNKRIECWYQSNNQKDSVRGTIAIFHGYSGMKSLMLDKAAIFLDLGYHVLLVDFMGSGGSEGNQTTLGFMEAEQVKTAFQFLQKGRKQNVYLFGTSMGAVAIMKAIHGFGIKPDGVILECPFGSMYQTTCARFRCMNVPGFPMAGLLVFWGGIENGFWAFGHNPVAYARKISCPILLLYGEQDRSVSRTEIDNIYMNLPGPKMLRTYAQAGHENYLSRYKKEWIQDIQSFLLTCKH